MFHEVVCHHFTSLQKVRIIKSISRSFVFGGVCLSKIDLESEVYKRVEKNLTLENFTINKQVALQAIETVNEGKSLTPKMIKEVVKLGKV